MPKLRHPSPETLTNMQTIAMTGPLDQLETKVCRKCGTPQLTTLFRRRFKDADVRYHDCNSCHFQKPHDVKIPSSRIVSHQQCKFSVCEVAVAKNVEKMPVRFTTF